MTQATVTDLPLIMADHIRPLMQTHAARMQALFSGKAWTPEEEVAYEAHCAAEQILIDALPYKTRLWWYQSWLPFVSVIGTLGRKVRYGW